MAYKNPKDKLERERARRKAKQAENKDQNRALFLLYDAIQTGELVLDAEEFVEDPKILIGLAKRKLAKKVDKGLWRITLQGLLHVRQTYSLV